MKIKGNRIAAYARYSSEKQNESSIEDQLRRLRAYIESQSLTVSEVFTDYAISGASLKRQGFESMMQAVKARQLDCVIVEDVSRLSRDNADALKLYKEFSFYGVQLISLSDGIDSTSRGAKLNYSMKALMSDMYLEDLRDKTLRGMEGKAVAKLNTGGRLFGYKSVPILENGKVCGARKEIDPKAAKIVVEIFELYAKGSSTKEIAKYLNSKGILAPRAKTKHKDFGGWGHTTIGAMLRNKKYSGQHSFNEKKWVRNPATGKRKSFKKDESEVISHERPELRIVSDALWTAVQERADRVANAHKKGGQGASGVRNRYWLSGLLICGVCKTTLRVAGGGKYYVCGRHASRGTCTNTAHLKRAEIEQKILDILQTALTPQAMAMAKQKWTAAVKEFSAKANEEQLSLETSIEKVSKEVSNLVEVIKAGGWSAAVKQAISEGEARKKQLEKQLAEVRAASKAVDLPDDEDFAAAFGDLKGLIELDPAAAKEQVRALFMGEGIVLSPDSSGSSMTMTGEANLLNLLSSRGSSGGLQRPYKYMISLVFNKTVGVAGAPKKLASRRASTRNKRVVKR